MKKVPQGDIKIFRDIPSTEDDSLELVHPIMIFLVGYNNFLRVWVRKA